MILLITPSDKAESWAGAIQAGTGEPVRTAGTLRDGMKLLRDHEFTVVAYDEYYVEGISLGAESLLAQCGTAVPLGINFSISRIERVVRSVNSALRRAKTERMQARKAAADTLRHELNSSLTGILLSADLALKAEALPDAAQQKLRSIQQLARNIRQQLDTRGAPGRTSAD